MPSRSLTAVAVLLMACAHSAMASDNCNVIDAIPNPFGIPYNPVAGACSGNGDCVSDVCVCKEGWTGRSDFLNTEFQDCHVNKDVITGLWALCLFLSVVYTAVSAKRIRTRWQQYQDTKTRKQLQGVKYGLRNNRGMATIIVCFGFMLPVVAVTSILKIVRPEERIGVTAGVTILFGLGKLGFYSAAYLFQPALIASILRGSRTTKRIVRLTYSISAVLSIMGVITGFSPIITLLLSDGNDNIAKIMFYFYFVGAFLQLLGLGVQAFWTRNKVSAALDMSYSMDKSQRTLDIKNALVAVERENVIQTVLQGSIFFLFAFMPFMSNAHDYFFPISWLAYSVLSRRVAATTLSDSKYGTKTGTATGSGQDSKNDSKTGGGSKDLSFSRDPRSYNQPSTYVSVVGSPPPGAPPQAPQSPGGVTPLAATRFYEHKASFVEDDVDVGSAHDSDFV